MQFAVILHECFKCHTHYSASIKVSWMANKFSSKEMFSSGLPGIRWRYFHSFMHANTYRKTHCEQDNSTHWIHTYIVHHICEHAVCRGLCHFIFGSNRLLFCLVSCVTASHIQGQWAVLVLYDTHTDTYTLLFPRNTMCYDWQIDWPTDCCCGASWQVEIGKWEAHFSLPSAEQKIKAFSSTEAIGRGGAQGVQVVE